MKIAREKLTSKLRRHKDKKLQETGTASRTSSQARERVAPLILAGKNSVEQTISSKPSRDLDATVSIEASSLWKKAVAVVEESPEWAKYQKALPNISSADDGSDYDRLTQLVNTACERAAKQETKSEGRKAFTKVCDAVLSTLSAVNGLGAATTPLNPYAAVAWGSIMFVVSSAQNYKDVRELCWESIPRMAVLLSKYQVCEDVYLFSEGILKTRPALENAMEALYTALLYFQIRMVIYTRSRLEKIKTPFIPKDKSSPQEELAKIGQLEQELTKQLRASNGELSASTLNHVVALKKSLAQIQEDIEKIHAVLDHVSKVVDKSLRTKILDWISPIRYEDSHERAEKKSTPGTTDWILENTKYQTWASSDESDGIWLYGPMGTGKSCLAHAVIEDMKTRLEQHGPSHALAYFYCDGVDRKDGKRLELTTENILCCLTKQIAMSVDEHLPEAVIQLYERQHPKASGPTTDQCIDFVWNRSNSLRSITIVLDGLDECPLAVQGDVLSRLEDTFIVSSLFVKILIASRQQGCIENILDLWFAKHVNVVEHNEAAIKMMIDYEVRKAALSPVWESLYCRPGQNQIEKVIKILQENAGGMFRWVKMALDYLHNSPSYQEMEYRLGELKQLPDLFDLYKTIYNKIMLDKSKSGQRNARVITTALIMLLHGRPLYGEEVVYSKHLLGACAFAATETLVDAYDISEITKLCPSFIVKGLMSKWGERPLRLPHFSVKEFLLEKEPRIYSKAAGHTYLASLCLEVFIGPDLLDQAKSFSFVEYAAEFWLDHLRIKHAREQSTTEKNRPEISNDVLSRYAQATAQFLPTTGVSTSFRRWHSYGDSMEIRPRLTTGISYYAHTTPCTGLYAHIILGTNLGSEKAFAEEYTAGEYKVLGFKSKKMSPLAVAAIWGRLEAVEWITQQGADYLDEHRYSLILKCFSDPLLANTDIGRHVRKDSLIRVVKWMLNNGAQLTPREIAEFILQNYTKHCKALVQALHETNHLFTTDEDDLTMMDEFLGYSLFNISDRILQYLPLFLEHGFGQPYLDRWLLLAATDSSSEVVAWLIENGANSQARDPDGKSALDLAKDRLGKTAKKLGGTSRSSHIPRQYLKAYLEACESFKTLVHASSLDFNYEAKCNGCDKDPITGDRHMCLNCPNFDYCSNCYITAVETHPGHEFTLIYSPEDDVLVISDSSDSSDSDYGPPIRIKPYPRWNFEEPENLRKKWQKSLSL